MLSGAESKGKPDCAGLMVDADKCSTLRRKKKNLHLRIVCITVTTESTVLCMGRDQPGVQHQAKNSGKGWEGKGISRPILLTWKGNKVWWGSGTAHRVTLGWVLGHFSGSEWPTDPTDSLNLKLHGRKTTPDFRVPDNSYSSAPFYFSRFLLLSLRFELLRSTALICRGPCAPNVLQRQLSTRVFSLPCCRSCSEN